MGAFLLVIVLLSTPHESPFSLLNLSVLYAQKQEILRIKLSEVRQGLRVLKVEIFVGD